MDAFDRNPFAFARSCATVGSVLCAGVQKVMALGENAEIVKVLTS